MRANFEVLRNLPCDIHLHVAIPKGLFHDSHLIIMLLITIVHRLVYLEMKIANFCAPKRVKDNYEFPLFQVCCCC